LYAITTCPASSQRRDNDNIIVSIKDTGTGIDPEIMPRLFSKFATKSFIGTGLGLFISKKSLKLMVAEYGLKIIQVVKEPHLALVCQ
jgi:signal transduction histidine kinase